MRNSGVVGIEHINNAQHSFLEPEEFVSERETMDLLRTSLDRLSDTERLVIIEYFFNESVMDDIAIKVGVTESRISQILREAILKLKKYMSR